jgi:long-chain acyl-CoA synthetase
VTLPAETVTGLYLHALAENASVAYRAREGRVWRDWTWSQVEARVRELAHGLLALGLSPGDRLGIVAETCLEWTLLDLAALSTGVVTVPAYTTSTLDDLEHVLRDGEVRLVVAGDRVQADRVAAVRERLPSLETVAVMAETLPVGDEVRLDRIAAMGVTHAASHPTAVDETRAAVQPDDLMTLIYTSGTTGQPRGCRLLQRNYAAMARIACDVPGIVRPGDRILVYLPLAHTFARLMPYVALAGDLTTCFGTGLERIREDLVDTRPHLLPTVPRLLEKAHAGLLEQLDAAHGARRRLGRWALGVGERASTVRQHGQPIPPGLALQQRLADRMLFHRVRARFGGEVRAIVSGGAALEPEIARALHALDLLVLEGYGQTECTTACAFNRPHRYRLGTVGPAMPHVELRIGEDGEIETRGPHVFDGYHNDPAASEAVLVDGWLRTGDVGEIDDDGFLWITDRKRDLITTTTGKNVAPQRVEGRLKVRPGISQALVLGDRRPYLVALVTADESLAGRPADEVRQAVEGEVAAVNETLAHGEQIRRFAVLDEDFTPAGGELTPTLKVRRRLVEERYADVIAGLYTGA